MQGVFRAGRIAEIEASARGLAIVRALVLTVLWISGCATTDFGRSTIRGQSPQVPTETRLTRLPSVAPSPLSDLSSVSPNDQIVVEVRIEGNTTIPEAAILKRVKVQPGRPLNVKQIQDDIRELFATGWFASVDRRVRPAENGLVLVYFVTERPILKSVEYRGNKKVKTKSLKDLTGLKPGGAFDISANRESVRRLLAEYRRRGYRYAEVTLEKGDSPEDREVIFLINEGPVVRVTRVGFDGNEAFSGSLLKTKLQTKRAWFGLLGGKYDPSTIPNDIASLQEYYHALGYFDVKIDPKEEFNETRSRVHINYEVDEGVRYKVRNVEIAGNHIYNEEELREIMKTLEGEYYNGRLSAQDITAIREKYGELGRLFANVELQQRYLEEPGVVDLVYNIDEDKVYRVRQINVNIQGENPHTQQAVALDRVLLFPGDPADPSLIQRSKRRLEGTQVFETAPGKGPSIRISRVPEKPADTMLQVRGQNYDSPIPPPNNPVFQNSPQGDPFGDTLREGAPDWLEIPETYYELPGEVDLDIDLLETRTGRLMFGVGVNSDAGVVGSIVLDETNFDILRPPQSFDDILEGHAFRGAGQRFRLEAIPGSEVSRYSASWSDPYFMHTDNSLSLSGFYFTRFYQDWNETRTGGRVSVGRQINRDFSLGASFRGENVEISNPVVPTPPSLAEAVGDNLLTTVGVRAAHDTRDAAFLPASGHFIELAAEQAFGDFDYTRLDASASQYFTLYSRPDGGGRHILSMRGQVGWTATDTPIFEKFYAGGYSTFRGFRFRGVSPRQFDAVIGGSWLTLGTVEYMAPLTADEFVQAVVFTDFGTVEENVSLDQFRMTVGAGLRLTVPALGPVPIALDWAVPIARQEEDQTQVFSFYVGIAR